MTERDVNMPVEKPILYTTNCPRCTVLESKLNSKGIEYEMVYDINEMEQLGIQTAPVLKVAGEMMDFGTANKWVNEQ